MRMLVRVFVMENEENASKLSFKASNMRKILRQFISLLEIV